MNKSFSTPVRQSGPMLALFVMLALLSPVFPDLSAAKALASQIVFGD